MPAVADQQRLADIAPEVADSYSWIWKARCSRPVLPEPVHKVILDLCPYSSADLGEGEDVGSIILNLRMRSPMAPVEICRSRRRSRLSSAEEADSPKGSGSSLGTRREITGEKTRRLATSMPEVTKLVEVRS
ncbi:hypothetical protein BHE74_00058995 [Ensete ventricosum]|nr:hypothetical protein BHE74_00058995 [Ensete ventricosum]